MTACTAPPPRDTGPDAGAVEHTAPARLADRRLTARAGLALVLANARYWPTVAPLVRAQLYRWKRRAHAIPDPVLRALASQKLREEHFHAEVAATLAVTAPRAHRACVVEAIVAYEVMFDYLDGLTEQPTPDPLRNGNRLFRAFTDAITPHAELGTDYYRCHPSTGDGGYLAELAGTVRTSLAGLPAATAIAEVAQGAATRCAEAQVRAHAVAHTGAESLESWAMRGAAGTALRWNEYLAGAASSVLTVHALIAAAADRHTTRAQAAAIDTVYLSIAVLATLLDSLIDYEGDMSSGGLGYIRYHMDHELLARRLPGVARHAAAAARHAPNGAHHVMTLVGVVAFYTSAPTATGELAGPPIARLQRELRPLITPTLAVMRAWRIAKRLRQRPRQASHTPQEQPA